MTHEYDSSQTCNYCGIAEEKAKPGDSCPNRTDRNWSAPIPGPGPSRSVELATEYLVKVVEQDVGVKNGTTALYCHLIGVIQQHAGKRG